MDFWSQFTIYSLAILAAFFVARIYYYGWRLRTVREQTGSYSPYDLLSKRLSVQGAVSFTIALLFVIEWMQGELWFLADILHVPRVPMRHSASMWILVPHVLIALATGAMFAIIALRYTGLRDRLRHRKLVYACLGLIMLTSILGSALLASL